MEKLYIVVRADLPAGLQLAQGCHALQAFNDQHRGAVTHWKGNLVVLQTPNMASLVNVLGDIQRSGIPCVLFCEPDIGGEPTAFAAAGDAAALLSQLPLALKPTVAQAA